MGRPSTLLNLLVELGLLVFPIVVLIVVLAVVETTDLEVGITVAEGNFSWNTMIFSTARQSLRGLQAVSVF